MESGAPVAVTIEAGDGGEGPRLVSATLLPHRALMLYQLAAWTPKLGAVDVLASPPLAEGLQRLNGGPADVDGGASFSMGGAFALPFVNRLRGRPVAGTELIETRIAGRDIRLPARRGGKGPGAERYAIHGLMRTQALANLAQSDLPGGGARLTACLAAGDFDGRWPSSTDVAFDMLLTPAAFEARIRATNAGGEALPMAIGWHPYFRIPSGRRGQARLRIPAAARLPVNDYDEVLPTGAVLPVEGTPYDFALFGGRELGEAYLDDCFTGLQRSATGEAVCELVDPAAGYGLRLASAWPEVIAVQAYAPPAHAFVAIEPQTSFADPYGAEWGAAATGARLLQPGEALEYRVRIELFAPADGDN